MKGPDKRRPHKKRREANEPQLMCELQAIFACGGPDLLSWLWIIPKGCSQKNHTSLTTFLNSTNQVKTYKGEWENRTREDHKGAHTNINKQRVEGREVAEDWPLLLFPTSHNFCACNESTNFVASITLIWKYWKRNVYIFLLDWCPKAGRKAPHYPQATKSSNHPPQSSHLQLPSSATLPGIITHKN